MKKKEVNSVVVDFVSRYVERSEELNSVLCPGFDLTPAHVPPVLRTGNDLEDMEKYLHFLIRVAARKAPVVKFQLAFYEAFGPDGIALLIRSVSYAKSLGLLVILDAKKADIGNTMTEYGRSVFGQINADACTFVPYLGSTFMPAEEGAKDQIWLPWLAQGRMVIPMIRTSNPEATQLQDERLANGLLVYEHMAQLVRQWNETVRERTNGLGSVGGVVGATWPEQAPRCRELAGDDVFFLIPGYGAQGGGSEGAVAGILDSKGKPKGTVNFSRGGTQDPWFDRKTGKPREGDHLKLVEQAIHRANADLNGAIAALKKKKAS